MKAKIILPAIALGTVAIVGWNSVGMVSAHGGDGDYGQTLVQRITERFGLNQTEVDQVVEEFRNERHDEMEARFEQMINDSDLTDAQKQAVLAKHEEIQQKIEALRDQDLDRDAMKEEMDAIHDEMRAWAESEGIDLSEFRFGQMDGSGRSEGRGQGIGRGMHR